MQNRNITNTKERYQKSIMMGRFIGYTPISNGIGKCKILCQLLQLYKEITGKNNQFDGCKTEICSHHPTTIPLRQQKLFRLSHLKLNKKGKQWLLYPNVLLAVLSYNDWYTSRWELREQKKKSSIQWTKWQSSIDILQNMKDIL